MSGVPCNLSGYVYATNYNYQYSTDMSVRTVLFYHPRGKTKLPVEPHRLISYPPSFVKAELHERFNP